MSTNKPKFNASQPFEAVKPKFDPNAQYTSEQAQSSTDVPVEDVGQLEALARGAAQGASFGTADEITGALSGSPTGAFKTIANLLGADYNDADVQAYKARRDEARQSYKTSEEAHPITSLIGNVAGGIVPAAFTGGAGELTNLQHLAKVGALEGAAFGGGQSEAENLGSLAKDSAVGGAIGGTLGAATGQLGKFLMGNAGDVARGVTPASQAVKGAIPDLAESKLGSRLKGFFKAGQEGIDTSSEAAEASRGVANKEEAGKILDVAQKKSQEVGKAIGERVEAVGPFTPKTLEEVLPQLPQVVQEEVMQVLPGRMTKVSDAPKVLQEELQSVEKNIQQIIEVNPQETVKHLQKVSTDLIDPAILDGELQYNQIAQAQAQRIKQALQENPQQTLGDLYNTIINKEAPSAELDDLFQQIKYKSVVAKLAKEAQVNTGSVPQPIQDLQNLLNKKSALKKAVAQFGKTELLEPDQVVKSIVTRLDDAHIAESDKAPARKLKDIISKYVKNDGTVAPEKTVEFRNSLNAFTKSTDSYEIGSMAKKLGSEIGAFRREAAGELSEQFHDIKSFADMLKIDTTGLSDNEIKNAVAPRFAKFLEKSESTATMDSGRMQDLVDKFVEATGNDPEIKASLDQIAKNAKYSELHKVKSGSTGSMFNDGVNRLLFAFPLETAGQISASPILQKVASTTASTSDKLLSLPAAGWRNISAKLSTSSPTMSKIAAQMADNTDQGKKRALLNVLNQMPAFRKSIASIAGITEE